jgi:predicted phosphodiesterase
MKYAIFSDIHGNLEALEAVLAAMEKEKPTEYYCVGDIVGYGANPKECIDKVRGLKPIIICGNHDWASCGLTDVEYFNTFAKEAILWTGKALGEDDLAYLKSLKLTHQNTEVTLVHGTLDCPEEFSYIMDGYAARRTMVLMKTPVCFIGHSHVAGTFYENRGIVNYSSNARIQVRRGNKYIVNVGSVGQPRDGDPRASYCIYDEERQSIDIKRVAYDIERAQKKILEARLPKILAQRLGEGQ